MGGMYRRDGSGWIGQAVTPSRLSRRLGVGGKEPIVSTRIVVVIVNTV